MKRLRKDNIIKRNKVKASLLELKILQEIDHPFLLGLNYFFQTEYKLYFIMPFVRGGELFEHLQEVEVFPEERAKIIAMQIALGLGHLHSKNIVYRDLKPENVLIGEDGYAYVIDFGISKKLEPKGRTNSFCGTPEYFAPELIR